MIRIPLNNNEANSLYLEIDKYLQSVNRRSVSYTLHTFNSSLAVITLTLSKLSGSTSKTIICQYDDTNLVWNVYTPKEAFQLESLGQLQSICKYTLNKMRAHLGRI